MKRCCIGVLAHVDAGKTTLSEALLYRSGAVRRLGRVDHGDAVLDTHALERSRGITIFSKQAMFRTGDTSVTLVDTPGHVDFSAETERALCALDYAVLVVSGSEGVQSHTELLWRMLRRFRIPTLIFVNKTDLPGFDRDARMDELCRRLSPDCVDFTLSAAQRDEAVALCGDELTERYLEQGALPEELIRRAIAERTVFPCFFGAALRLEGVDALLDALDRWTVEPPRGTDFGARVFRVTTDEQGHRLTHLKITGGTLHVRDALPCGPDGASEKISQIRLYSGARYTAADEAPAGTVCAVTGLSIAAPGQGLGVDPGAAPPQLEPVLAYRVVLPPDVDLPVALRQLRRLEEEDPLLRLTWNERLQELQIRLMGEVQLEIVRSLAQERFGLTLGFEQGRILYKETIAAPVEGMGHFEPLRHYAEVHLLMEPLPRGSGLVFAADCREDQLDRNWQRLVLTHLYEKTHLGVLIGAPITDMKITLVAGRAHLKHTEGGDFRQATYRAVRQGLRTAQSILLEPIYAYTLEVPADQLGRAMTDLQRRGARFDPPEQLGETAVLCGTAPVVSLRDYAPEVAAYTRGRGRLVCESRGYDVCHDPDAVRAQYAYDPDADTENTADSVFCSHGAGHPVRWDEAPAMMHVQVERRPDEPEADSEPAVTRSRGEAYRASIEQDKELVRIFERTYGPIRRDARAYMHTERRPAVPPGYRAKPLPAGPEYLLVDGYNIIFAWEELQALAADSLEAARDRLIEILSNYQGYRQCELILVFDAYKVRGGIGEVERHHGVSVVYTKEAETADMYIEKVTHRIGDKRRVRVATSDRLEQIIILGHGAQRISATAFEAEVHEVEAAIREILESL